MASSIFFNGRQWITPATMTRVDDTAMLPRESAVGNVLAIVGKSTGGKPNTALRFGSPEDAASVLISGELLDAVQSAFGPSAELSGPSEVIAIRVGTPTQASLALVDATPATVITLTSDQYGLPANQVKAKVESGTNRGKKLTVQLGTEYYTADDVARDAFTIQYAGTGGGTMTINGTQLVLVANSSTVATIPFADYDTVGKLVDRINAVTGFTAAAVAGSEDQPTAQGLDFVTTQDVKTTLYTATANLQAVVDWFNGAGEGFVTATRAANVGTLPANIPFTYLSGGTDPSVVNGDWTTAFTALQGYDVQWVVALSGLAAIHTMLASHCQFCTDVLQKERRSLTGPASATNQAAVILLPKAINSDRLSLVWSGHYAFDAAGKLVLRPPYMTAALLGGMAAGADPGTPLTNKSVRIQGLEYSPRRPVDTDELIRAGVLCLEDTPQGFKVVRSISTWLRDNKYNRVEISTGAATDYVTRSVRQALDALRGEPGDPLSLGRAVTLAEDALRACARPRPEGPGVIVGDANSPAYRNIQASLEGDTIRVTFECSPVIPVNFIPITIHVVPYSGTASA